MASGFAQRLVAWQREHGRHDLPWQEQRDPYPIWLAEIMLQQTQVATVIPYFQRFVARLPTLADLAQADDDLVMSLWSGLGYYSRARNLHRCARQLLSEYGGRFPEDASVLETLPGIGRSTAAAIAVFAFGARAAILDGNVRRVLARVFVLDGDPTSAAVQRRLWALAQQELPLVDVPAYTQGLMDLGATVCTRSRARCDVCPVMAICEAHRQGRVAELPARRRRKPLARHESVMLLLIEQDRVLLERRPPSGIWGGLWSLPERRIDDGSHPDPQARALARDIGFNAHGIQAMRPFDHAFTHFRLRAHPYRLAGSVHRGVVEAPGARRWFALETIATAPLPGPIKALVLRVRASDDVMAAQEILDHDQTRER